MRLVDRIRLIGDKAKAEGPNLQTKRATKSALILPFIQALGYDISGPTEVIPEFRADAAGTKKGDKIDYAITRAGRLVMLVECRDS